MKDLVFDLINNEKVRQTEGLELIPSENYVSANVLKAMGSVLTNKYSEGYPSFEGLTDWPEDKIAEEILPNYRYYGGQTNIDRIERLAIERACKLFHADHANVQPHSGAQANNAVYFAWLEPGNTVLGMSLPAGGHLTHGAKVTLSAHIYNFIGYGVTEDGDIDYDELERLALEHLPKLILVGYSAFMKIPDFARVAKIREAVSKKSGHEVLLMADMSHVAGLIAGGVHPNPLDFGFDVMTTTTHKTLRGPRGGLILAKEEYAKKLNSAVFPGTQGGPLEHIIAAKAVCLKEAMSDDFKVYAKNVVDNAQVMAKALLEEGFDLITGGTDNHLMLADLRPMNITGAELQIRCDANHITLNKNAIPGDPQKPSITSGVRIGTAAATTRGLGAEEMKAIAHCIGLTARDFEGTTAEVKATVAEICKKFPMYV